MKFGINLYSLRTLIGNEEDFLKTAIALSGLGYDTIQFSGAPYDPEVIRRVSAAAGLPVVVTHVPMDRIINDTDALMKEHESFGCRCIGLGAMPPAVIRDEENFKQTVEKLNGAGKIMADNGFTFCYHNHHFEQYRTDGRPALDYIIENAGYVHFTADVYWLQYGGADVLKTLKKMSGRADCIHLKDYRINAKTDENGSVSYVPGFAPVGDGVLDFKAIIKTAKECGTKHFLVEQDDAVSYQEPLEQVKRSITYLKENFG